MARTLLYPVKSGDTLYRIANRFDVSIKEIQNWNELKSPEKIYPGQVLKIILNAGDQWTDLTANPNINMTNIFYLIPNTDDGLLLKLKSQY